MRIMRSALPTLAGLFIWAGSVLAQVPLSGTRPPVSPYINLARPGGNPAIDYYGLVRPQLDFRQDVLGLNQQIGANEMAINSAASASKTLPPTGVAANFSTQARYFMTRGGRLPGQTGGFRPGGSFAPGTIGTGQLQLPAGR
jgi:hypothetical protein